MIALLTHANHQDNLNCLDGKVPIYESKKYQSEVRDLRALYDAILAQAQAENPIDCAQHLSPASPESSPAA
jgi:transposase